jgi:indolepyruvate ferredoxin oxidoreductase
MGHFEKPPLRDVSLDDKYTHDKARAYMTGIEALVRLPMLQHQRDQARGLNTAGFVSGYRGSPLGGVDQAMWKAKKFLEPHNIHFQPGLNEDLAATAVWGSQQTNLFEGARYDGVFGMWYGKGPGVDRSMDVIKTRQCLRYLKVWRRTCSSW